MSNRCFNNMFTVSLFKNLLIPSNPFIIFRIDFSRYIFPKVPDKIRRYIHFTFFTKKHMISLWYKNIKINFTTSNKNSLISLFPCKKENYFSIHTSQKEFLLLLGPDSYIIFKIVLFLYFHHFKSIFY